MPVRMEADGWKVLLVSTRRSAETWVFPKGAIGRNERPKEAAIRETREVRDGPPPWGGGGRSPPTDGGASCVAGVAEQTASWSRLVRAAH